MTIQQIPVLAKKMSFPRGMPDLSIIGVHPTFQNRSPGANSFPAKFNGDSRVVWKKMFESTTFLTEMKNLDSVDDKWYKTIMEFLQRCEAEGVLPFANVTEQDKNDAAIGYLTSARISLVKFIDGIEFFSKYKIRGTIVRSYIVKENGMTVKAVANLAPILDPTFEKWLVTAPTPRFQPSFDQTYVKHPRPNVEVFVQRRSETRIKLGYSIDIGTVVSIPGKRLPTRKDVDAFMERQVWLPIIRAHRFENVLRLF